jgi:DNA (cytosine-5)-methyltransferase 1
VRLLDLFCGAGGAAVGYHRAGFEVVGVDIVPQPHYPFEFHQADALTFPLDGFDVIHASPPCQGYTTMNNRHGSDVPKLIIETQNRLADRAVPYVIENVPGAKRWMYEPFTLTGEMFGLRVHRPRLFRTSWSIAPPSKPPRQHDPVAVYGKQDGRLLWRRKDGTELRVADLATASAAMGIDWMDWDEICQAIPPAYTEWIGRQFTHTSTNW